MSQNLKLALTYFLKVLWVRFSEKTREDHEVRKAIDSLIEAIKEES